MQTKLFSTQPRRLPIKCPITLTPTATEKIRSLINKKDNVIGIEIDVMKRGCNGFKQQINYLYSNSNDPKKSTIHTIDGVNIKIPKTAEFVLIGSLLDWVSSPVSEEFVFTNPLAKQCGCGESMTPPIITDKAEQQTNT